MLSLLDALHQSMPECCLEVLSYYHALKIGDWNAHRESEAIFFQSTGQDALASFVFGRSLPEHVQVSKLIPLQAFLSCLTGYVGG